MTTRDTMIRGLEAIDGEELPYKGTKYVKYRVPSTEWKKLRLFVYVGRRGSIRIGRTIQDSITSDTLKERLRKSAVDPEYAAVWAEAMKT